MDSLLIAAQTELLESHLFTSKPQMQRLLTYLIKHSYDNNLQALQQKPIAINCLGRTSGFIPSQDPIVRIEVARLRKLLDAYYQGGAKLSIYKISLPKGSYKVCFSRNENNTLSSGLGLLLVCQSPEKASSNEVKLMMKVRRELALRISCFNHIDLKVEYFPQNQIAQSGSMHLLAEKKHEYVLRIEILEDRKGGCLVSGVVVDRNSQEILWSNTTTIPIFNNCSALDFYCRFLTRSLVAESYGLLGQHWSKSLIKKGVDSAPVYQVSWVYLIALASTPTEKLAVGYLSFLRERLEKYPNDYVALAGYYYVIFVDSIFHYGLFNNTIEESRQQLLQAVCQFPTHDSFSILLGLYSFAVGDHNSTKIHLETGRQLNPHNTRWAFLYGGLLYFMGEKEQGLAVIDLLNKDYSADHFFSGYCHLPKLLSDIDQSDPLNVFQLVANMGLRDENGEIEGQAKPPNLADYCI